MMSNDSNEKEIGIENRNYAQVINPYELFTTSAVVDDLTFHLCSMCDFQIDKETKIIYLSHKYLDYADKFLFLINLCRPSPKFELSRQDIPHKLQEHLTKLDANTVNSILTNVVRRILESVNPVYYYTNGIYGKVKWRIID